MMSGNFLFRLQEEMQCEKFVPFFKYERNLISQSTF